MISAIEIEKNNEKSNKGNEEERRQKQDTLLSIIGATTIPRFSQRFDGDEYKFIRMWGHKWTCTLCDVLGSDLSMCYFGIVILFTYRYILKRNADK